MEANPFGEIISSLPKELLDTLPAMNPPPGKVPNFVDPYSKGPVLVIVSTVTLVLGLFFFAIRIYTKVYLVRKAAWDDCESRCLVQCLGCQYVLTTHYSDRSAWTGKFLDFHPHQLCF